jgi:hypothetical protein
MLFHHRRKTIGSQATGARRLLKNNRLPSYNPFPGKTLPAKHPDPFVPRIPGLNSTEKPSMPD